MDWLYTKDNYYSIQKQPDFDIEIISANGGWWNKGVNNISLRITADFRSINADNEKVVINGVDFIETYSNPDVVRVYLRYTLPYISVNQSNKQNVVYDTYYKLNGKNHVVFKYSKYEKIFGTK